jgi:hypothetical protein
MALQQNIKDTRRKMMVSSIIQDHVDIRVFRSVEKFTIRHGTPLLIAINYILTGFPLHNRPATGMGVFRS